MSEGLSSLQREIAYVRLKTEAERDIEEAKLRAYAKEQGLGDPMLFSDVGLYSLDNRKGLDAALSFCQANHGLIVVMAAAFRRRWEETAEVVMVLCRTNSKLHIVKHGEFHPERLSQVQIMSVRMQAGCERSTSVRKANGQLPHPHPTNARRTSPPCL